MAEEENGERVKTAVRNTEIMLKLNSIEKDLCDHIKAYQSDSKEIKLSLSELNNKVIRTESRLDNHAERIGSLISDLDSIEKEQLQSANANRNWNTANSILAGIANALAVLLGINNRSL